MVAMTPMTFAPCVSTSSAQLESQGSSKENVQRLEQKARTLSDYAAQLKAAAKRTKAVAKAKPRRSELIHWPSKDGVRKASEDSIESTEETHVSIEQPCKVNTDDRTTLMLQNLPSNYTRDALCKLLDSSGARGHYNFVYLPKDFKTMAGFGYAFVNFVHNSHAVNIMDKLQGFSDWQIPSIKVLTVVWSNPHQGLHAHVERYRDSPVMHEEVSDEFKPMLLENGVRVDFPPPTKRLKPPRVRKASGLEQGTS
jgi:RNA recognition motif-containing protein